MEAHAQVWDKLLIRESMIKQESRCRWLMEGEKNSKFFHSFMKSRFCHNNIVGLKQKGIVVDDVAGVKQLDIEHFQDLF